MTEAPTTCVSLLVRIRDLRDAAAWAEFVDLYGPLIYSYCRRHGLQDADSADVTQDVLCSVARAMSDFRYDARRGSFRSWLFTVARTKRIDFVARKGRHPEPNGDSELIERLNQLPASDPGDLDAVEWERAFEQRLLDWVSAQVRSEVTEATWKAFWMTAVEETSSQKVAEILGMSVGAVYAARYRVLSRLREKTREARCDPLDFQEAL
jgi:RNA polymerase sigma-70 factor (ECF subfamily)